MIGNTYYSKKEFNEMKNRLTKQLKSAETKIERLEARLKTLQKEYETLKASTEQ